MRLTLDIVKPRDFLKLFLQRVSNQIYRVAKVRARPLRRNHSRFDGKRRIFIAGKLFVTDDASGHNEQHQKGHQLLLFQRPGRKIKALLHPGPPVCQPRAHRHAGF